MNTTELLDNILNGDRVEASKGFNAAMHSAIDNQFEDIKQNTVNAMLDPEELEE